jgi:8-oxo-dGTP pyrophosphatase MutT (NUDIX family)
VRRTREAVRLLVLDGDRLLLFRGLSRSRGTSTWITPGGGVEPGETDREAAVRELREETGLVIEQLVLEGPVHAETIEYPSAGDIVEQSQRYYLVRAGSFEIDRSGQEDYELGYLQEARWFTVPELVDWGIPHEPLYPPGLGALAARLLSDVEEQEVG